MKLIKLEELLKHSSSKPDQQTIEQVIDEKDNTSKLQALFVIIPPKAPNPKLHYHTQRESWILVLSGEGKEIVDGKEYPLKPHDSVLILPNEKHRMQNVGNTDLKYLEIYTLPSDFIAVE